MSSTQEANQYWCQNIYLGTLGVGFSCVSVCLRILVREENSLWGLILKSLVHKYTMAWIIYLFVGPIRTPDGDMEMKIKVLALIYTPSHF